MTQKLEDLFDLAPMVDTKKEIEVDIKANIEADQQQLIELDDTIDKIDAALPTVNNINTSDVELDHLAEVAEAGYHQLLVLGMDSDPSRNSDVLSTASSLLGHAIAAKNAKITNKLKVVQLQIQKARLDLQKLKIGEGNIPIDGESTLLDRNAILAQILDRKKLDS